MVNYNGQIFSGIANTNPNSAVPAVVSDTSTTNAVILPLVLESTRKRISSVKNAKKHNGLIPSSSFFGEIALNGVYVTPLAFDEGLITQDIARTVNIWNAGKSSRTISSIGKVATNGTLLQHDPTPINILPESEIKQTLTVFKSGPPFQNATYTYTIDSDIYIVTVTGRRIEAFLYEPNWDEGIKFKYKYLTILSPSKRFVEQRRPLYEKPRRVLEANFLLQKTEMQKIHNDLKRFNDSVIGVPIFQEYLKSLTTPLEGATVISVEQDIANFFNLNNFVTIVMIKDLSNPANNEIKDIASIDTGAKQITFTSAIDSSFPDKETAIYPLFLATLNELKPKYLNDRISSMGLKFEELRIAE